MSLFEPIFKGLNDAGVRYVVVGGLAVVLHGHARLTADLDIIVDLDEAQARRAIETLSRLGLRPRVPVDPRDFADASIRTAWVRDRGMQVFSMVDPANPMRLVDLFVEHPIPFEELWSRSREFDLMGTPVRVASIQDLIRMKQATGRAQDADDIKALQVIAAANRDAGND
jgi:predicted nucleotidyltransferase